MLAYVFWHRPQDAGAMEAYEQAQLAFHRSLARSRPVGMCASAVFRVPQIPWLPVPGVSASAGAGGAEAAGYEDWYLLEDFAALGVLNEAVVGHGHRTSHDEVARRYGEGTASVYGLMEGDHRADLLDVAAVAVWVASPPGSIRRMTGEMLGDGVDRGHASLWRRHLVLGQAPEYCLLAGDRARLGGASGVASTRLPQGWSATTVDREVLWHG
jgi:hypothetical protein